MRFTIGVIWLLALSAPAHAAEPVMPVPGYSVLFQCNVNAGKNFDDVWSVLEEFARVAPPRADRSSFLWTPLFHAGGVDFVWGINYPSLTAYAEARTAFEATPAWATWGARFNDVMRCDQSMVASEEVRAGVLSGVADREVDGIVDLFWCTLRDGATMAAVDDATRLWQAEMAKIPSEAARAYSAWRYTPHWGVPGQYDYGWTGAWPDLQTWARGETDYQAHAPLQAVEAQFDAASRCDVSLWFGYWIIAPQS
jgi:hypothetical protein